jgi:hypothetical protein
LIWFVLAVLASPFKSLSIEAENTVLRQLLALRAGRVVAFGSQTMIVLYPASLVSIDLDGRYDRPT